MAGWGEDRWSVPGGLVVRWLPITLAGSSPTEDANGIVTSDFVDNGGGRLTVSISTGSSQYDGLTECAIKRITVATIAARLGKSVADLTDGSHVLLVRLTPEAEIPRYAFLGAGWADDAAQASVTGAVVSAWRNAAADNVQPNIHDGNLDVIPPGGALARGAETRVVGALKYDATMATAFSVVGFTLDNANFHGVVAYEPTISKAPTHFVLATGSNNGSGVTGTLNVTVEIAAIHAASWPLALV